jgi:hypothetical protein
VARFLQSPSLKSALRSLRCLLCAFPHSPAKHFSDKAFFGFVPFVLFRGHPA